MPQIAIEYSSNLAGTIDAEAIGRAVHAALVEHAGADLANCKTRLVRLDHYLIGDGDAKRAMIHADVRILPGRSDDQKRRLGQAVLETLQRSVADISGFDLQLTVEVRELDGSNYHKLWIRE